MFEILHMDWNLKPIFTQKWTSVEMNCGLNPQPPAIPISNTTKTSFSDVVSSYRGKPENKQRQQPSKYTAPQLC